MASLKELYVRRKKLAEFSVLAGVSEEFLWELAEGCENLHLRRHHIVYSPGDPSDYVYFILKGEVEVERRQQQKEQEYVVLEFDKKYSNNGIKIRSYQGLQQPQPTTLTLGQGDSFGYEEAWLKQEASPETRKQQIKCRTSCHLYRVSLCSFKSVLLTAKNHQNETNRHILAEKNFTLTRQDDSILQKKPISLSRCNRQRSVRISLCKYNKLSNIPLELSSESRTLETKHLHRMNKSTIEHYELKKKELSSKKPRHAISFLNEENNFVNNLLQARAKKMIRAKYLFEEEPAQMKFQDRLRPKKLL